MPAQVEDTTSSMRLFVVEPNYESAPVERREPLAVSPRPFRSCGDHSKIGGHGSDAAAWLTCNPAGLFGATPRPNANVYRLLHAHRHTEDRFRMAKKCQGFGKECGARFRRPGDIRCVKVNGTMTLEKQIEARSQGAMCVSFIFNPPVESLRRNS